MKKSLCSLILSKFLVFPIFLLSVCVVSISIAQAEPSFEVLLGRLKQFDRSIDFRELRISYAETAEYNPYNENKDVKTAMSIALEAKRFEEAFKTAETILGKNYLDLDAHLTCGFVYKELGNSERADFHDFVVRGILRSLMNSGDGKSPETAFQVISISEEYVILDLLNLMMKEQKLVGRNGHQYDVMTAAHRETKETLTVYFNIDIPFDWLNRRFGK